MFLCRTCCGPNCYVPHLEGSPGEYPQMIVEIIDSTTIMNQGEGTNYQIQPVAGWCCPCMNGTWYLDNSPGSCQWGTAYEFSPFMEQTELPPGCEEPYPCQGDAFSGNCYTVNVGWITLVLTIGKISSTEVGVGLVVQNYMLQTGWGYACGAQYSARAVLPAPADGEYLDVSDWVTMEGVDDRPFGGNESCAWIDWEDSDGFMQPSIAMIRFKAGA